MMIEFNERDDEQVDSSFVERDEINLISKVNKDLREAGKTLSDTEARYLVAAYYLAQENRIRAKAQVRESSKAGEPNDVVTWSYDSFSTIENGIKSTLKQYVESHTVGRWLISIHGIGPVLSAGFMAHFSVNPWKCSNVDARQKKNKPGCKPTEPCPDSTCGKVELPTAGHFWRFAGLDPTAVWAKKTKRPWNADLKVLCWKAGQSFMKLRSNDKDIYGAVYAERKAYEVARNELGGNADTAARQLKEKNYKKGSVTRNALESGVLSDGQIDARARRYAVKLFVSHLHHVMYEHEFKKAPPKPYIIEHGGHSHFIAPPNW